jgi:hypothetical protein
VLRFGPSCRRRPRTSPQLDRRRLQRSPRSGIRTSRKRNRRQRSTPQRSAATYGVAARSPGCCAQRLGGRVNLSLSNLPKADGILLLDAHPGNTVNSMRSLNPAVLDENDPSKIDPSLDPFDTKNGYNPNGLSVYSSEFTDRYFTTQAARMNRLIDDALAMREEIKQGKGKTTDDAPFIAYHNRAQLMEFSMSVHPGMTRPQKLLKNDGSISAEVVRSVRVAVNNARLDKTLSNGTMFLTLTSFLSANAIRAKDSITDIDWCSSNNSTPCALRQITVPILVTAMGGHYFIADNEIHYDVAASKDKDFIVIEGSVHGQTPCEACSKITGQSYSNVTKNLYDYIAK